MTFLAPAILLVQPQLGENVGAAARAMFNVGLEDLRLVSPRQDLDKERACKLAMMGKVLIDKMKIYDDYGSALGDLHGCIAMTARRRRLTRPVMTPRQAAHYLIEQGEKGRRLGIIFGCEAWGLDNEAISMAEAIVSVPLEEKRSSLNLAQAVLLLSYEWRLATLEREASHSLQPENDNLEHPVRHGTLQALFAHLEDELRKAKFFKGDTKEERSCHRLRNCLLRAQLSEEEAHLWHGVIRSLSCQK